MVSFAPTVYKQFNKLTLNISYCPCKIKLDAFYFIFCIFYVAWGFRKQNRFHTYETYDHNNDQIVAIYVSLSGPPLKMQSQLKIERQTPASHIYGTSRMSVVEPVSRKRTRKVGLGRFINSMPPAKQVHARGQLLKERCPHESMGSKTGIDISTHRSALIPLNGIVGRKHKNS